MHSGQRPCHAAVAYQCHDPVSTEVGVPCQDGLPSGAERRNRAGCRDSACANLSAHLSQALIDGLINRMDRSILSEVPQGGRGFHEQ